MRRWLESPWFKAASALGLVALLLWWVDPARVWRSIVAADVGLLLVALAITPVVIGLKALRWMVLARSEAPIGFREALTSYLAGLVLATLTPLAAGEAARSMFVSTGDRASLTGKVILDKLVDLTTVAAFAAAGLLWNPDPAGRATGAAILAAALFAWILLLGATHRLEPDRASRTGRLADRLRAVAIGLARTDRRRLAASAALSAVGFAVFYLQAFVLLRAYEPSAPWAVVSFFPIVTLSTILPVGIGGLGIREWTAVLLLGRHGVAESAAFGAFFTHFLVVQVLPALFGAARIASFRRATRSEP